MKTLTIYDKHPDMDAYRVGGSFTPYAIVAKDKRFTDAELAAETYRQMTRACAESGMFTTRDGSDYTIIPGDALTPGPKRAETSRLADMKRFATLPHYDEVSS